MGRARGIGSDAMEIQGALTAVVVDVKKFLAWLRVASSSALARFATSWLVQMPSSGPTSCLGAKYRIRTI